MNICKRIRWEGRKSLWIDNSLYKWIFYLSNIQRRIRKQLLFSSSYIDLLKSKIKNRTNNPRTVLHPSHSTFEPSQACIYTIFPKRTIESQDRNCFEISIIQTSWIFSFFLFPSFYLNKAKSKRSELKFSRPYPLIILENPERIKNRENRFTHRLYRRKRFYTEPRLNRTRGRLFSSDSWRDSWPGKAVSFDSSISKGRGATRNNRSKSGRLNSKPGEEPRLDCIRFTN